MEDQTTPTENTAEPIETAEPVDTVEVDEVADRRKQAKRFIVSDRLHLLSYFHPRLEKGVVEFVFFQSEERSPLIVHSPTELGLLVSDTSAEILIEKLELAMLEF